MTYTSQSFLPAAPSSAQRLGAGQAARLGSAGASNLDMDIGVKGKGSIRTLIRLANSRALDEEDSVVQE